MDLLVESLEFSEGTAMVESEDELEDGEVSDDNDNEEEESEENVDLFDNQSMGSSDKENLENSHKGHDERRRKEGRRESVLKEKEGSKVERDWEDRGRRRENSEKVGGERSNFASSSHPRKHWDLHHEGQQGERVKSRREDKRR